MKPMNEMELSFPSSSANEGFARAAVAAFVSQLDPTVGELCDLKTAVSEAVTNCIVHAYRSTIGTVYISCRIFADGRVIIRIRDRGCGIPDVQQAMQPMFTTAGDERAGLGFAVMQSFTDRLHVSSRPGKGTSVILEKAIARRTPDHGK
jgi:stage II sporulation protein AB (anti-sigma F factor)